MRCLRSGPKETQSRLSRIALACNTASRAGLQARQQIAAASRSQFVWRGVVVRKYPCALILPACRCLGENGGRLSWGCDGRRTLVVSLPRRRHTSDTLLHRQPNPQRDPFCLHPSFCSHPACRAEEANGKRADRL